MVAIPLKVLRPKRNETPARRNKLSITSIAIVANERHGGRSYIVVRWRQRQIADLLHMEGFGDLLFVAFSVVAAAHSLLDQNPTDFLI